LINTVSKIGSVDELHNEQKGNLDPNESFNFGKSLGNFLLKNKDTVKPSFQRIYCTNTKIR